MVRCQFRLRHAVTLSTYSVSSARLRASPYHIGRAVSLLPSAELLAPTPRAWGLGLRPCQGLRTLLDLSQINGRLRPATSPNRSINTKHINQLSRFHAQKLSVLNLFGSTKHYTFWQKVVCDKIPCQNFVCDTQIQIPRLCGGFLYEAFSLAYDYTCMASFLVRVLHHNMHHVDLSVPQAGLPCSYVYPLRSRLFG